MRWTVRDLADMFAVAENTVTAWVRRDGMPAFEVSGEWRFDPMPVLDWVVARGAAAPDRFVQAIDETAGQATSLSAALARGGAPRQTSGADPAAVEATFLGALPAEYVPATPERRMALEEVLRSRRDWGLRRRHDGWALPGAKAPWIVPRAEPAITLCYFEPALELMTQTRHDDPQAASLVAADSQAIHVDACFVIVSPTVGRHLSLLARLARALGDERFRARLSPGQTIEGLVQAARGLPPLGPSVTREPALRGD